MTHNLFHNAKLGDMFLTTEKKQAVFLRLSENAENIFAFLYVKDWGIVQVFGHNGDEVNGDTVHSIIKKQEEPVSEDLDTAAKNVGQKYFPNEENIWARPNYEAVKAECAFKDGAKWQKKKTLKESEDAIQYVKENHSPDEVSDFQNAMNIAVMKAFDAGKEKMCEQMMKDVVEVEVKIDAGGYPYIPAIELYDYDKDVPLAKEGNKYKVILIKKD